MANIQLLLEAERRGILPPDKAALLQEARKRGLVSGGAAQPAAKERPGFFGSAQEAIQTLGLTDEAAAYAANPTDENRRKLLQAAESKYESVGGFGKGENIEYIKELLGGSLGFLVAPAAAAFGTSFVSTPVGGIAAGVGTTAAQYEVQALLRQAQEQERALAEGRTPEELSLGKATAAAAGQTALDYLGFKLFKPALRQFPFLRNLVSAEADVAEDAAAKLVTAAREGTLKSTGRGTVEGIAGGVAFEVPQEVAQQALERWQAGLSLTDEEGREELAQAAIGAAVLGPLIGGGAGAIRARAERSRAEELRGVTDTAQARLEELTAKPTPTAEETAEIKFIQDNINNPLELNKRYGALAVAERPEKKTEVEEKKEELSPAEALIEAPPKIPAEQAPQSMRYEPSTLTAEDLDKEIIAMEDQQDQLAALLTDPDQLAKQAKLAGITPELYTANVTQAFDNLATRLDIFNKFVDGTLEPVKASITPEVIAATGTSPEVAKALNVQVSPVTIPQGGSNVPAAAASQITQPSVSGTARGGAAVPPSGPISAGPAPTETLVEGLEPAARATSDVVSGEAGVEPALTTERTADQIFDEAEEARKSAIALLNKNGRRPAVNTKKRQRYNELVARANALKEEWAQKTREELAAKAAQTAPPTAPAPAVAAVTTAPAPAPAPAVATAGAPPTPPRPPGTTPSAAPQPPGKQPPKPPQGGRSSVGGLPNGTTGNVANAVARVIGNQPAGTPTLLDRVRTLLDSTTITDNMRSGIYAFISLPQQVQLFAKELPSLRELLNVLTARANAVKERREVLDRNLRKWKARIRKYDADTREKFYEIAHESTRWQVEFNKIDFKDHPNRIEAERLKKEFDNLPPDLQQTYWEMLDSYNKMADEYLAILGRNLSKRAFRRLQREMAKKRLKVYLPLFRQGDYWMSYENKKGDIVYEAFASNKARELAWQEAVKNGARLGSKRDFTKLENAFKNSPPGPMFSKVMQELDARGVPEATKRALYELYLDQIPAQSIRQQYRARAREDGAYGYKGYETDLLNVYATVGSRIANQLTNLEYIPEIDKVYTNIQEEALKGPAQQKSIAIKKFLQNLDMQMEFLRDPGHTPLVSALSSFSYYWYIIGNVSTALINTLQLPMVVYPYLAPKYGMNETGNAMEEASRLYFKGGWDNDGQPGGVKKWPSDRTFGVNLPKGSPLARLYDAAVRQGAIRRSTGYDILEARKKEGPSALERKLGDNYVELKTKTEQILSWTFQNSERFNREITLIAAFNLELKKNGGDVNAAIKEAVDVVNMTHGTTLAEASPRYFQTGVGKVMFTFKNFAQTMIFLQAKLLRDAVKGESKQVQKLAAMQLVGIMGMSFAFAGVQGMPFYGGLTVLIDLLQDILGDPDEPWDADEVAKRSVGALAQKGVVNQLLMADVASRSGFTNLLWREDDKRLEEIGPVLFAMEQLFGPSYAAGMSIYRGFNDYREGNYDRALEAMMPATIRNPLKAWRYYSEDAKTRDGAVIYDDFNAYELFLQTIGFTPTRLAARSEAGKETSKAIKDLENRKKALLNRRYLAITRGDKEMLAEVEAAIAKYNQSETVKKNRQQITNATKAQSLQDRRRRTAQSTYGVYTPPKMRPLAEERKVED